MPLTERLHCVLITGVNRGLGNALMQLFSQHATTVIGLTRNPWQPHTLPDNVRLITVDLAQQPSVAAVVTRIDRANLFPDVVINNAAELGEVDRSDRIVASSWQHTMQVNFHAPIQLSTAWLSHMCSHGYGRIINLSGGGATSPRPYFTPYACSKAALNKFTENLAAEVKGSGVTANSLAPGIMTTDMLQQTVTHCQRLKLLCELNKLTQSQDQLQTFTAAQFCLMLCQPEMATLTGRIFSAQWDDMTQLKNYATMAADENDFTMRRQLPSCLAND